MRRSSRRGRFGLTRSWLGISAIFLVDVAVLAVASNWPKDWQNADHVAWWVGVGVAVALTIPAVLTYRGITVWAAVGRWLRDWSGDPQEALTAACTPAIDHRRRYGRDVVGVREYRGKLVAVVAVEAVSDAPPSGRHHHHQPAAASAAASLPVDAVATALSQFDLRLDAIDIVSVEEQPIEGDIDGGGPDGRRRTWLVLHMDPLRNAAAVATRDSLASSLAVCAERLAQDLDRRRCVARPLAADEFGELDNAVLAGLQLTSRSPGWRHINTVDGYVTSYWVSPWDITSEALADLWLPETDATVVTIRVARREGEPAVSAWVRYHSAERLGKDDIAWLNPLTGRQLSALRSSLPAPAARPPLVLPSWPLDEGEPLLVPLGFGAATGDESGRSVALHG